jgi:hypothetical protein
MPVAKGKFLTVLVKIIILILQEQSYLSIDFEKAQVLN